MGDSDVVDLPQEFLDSSEDEADNASTTEPGGDGPSSPERDDPHDATHEGSSDVVDLSSGDEVQVPVPRVLTTPRVPVVPKHHFRLGILRPGLPATADRTGWWANVPPTWERESKIT